MCRALFLGLNVLLASPAPAQTNNPVFEAYFCELGDDQDFALFQHGEVISPHWVAQANVSATLVVGPWAAWPVERVGLAQPARR